MANIESVATGFKPAGAVHPVDQILPPARLAVYGLQHVLAFYAGAVIVPLLLAAAIGLSNEQLVHLISADLFTCGIASIIQSVGFWKVGVRLPLIQGVTFTAVAPMIAIGKAASTPLEGLLQIYICPIKLRISIEGLSIFCAMCQDRPNHFAASEKSLVR